jgi:hypothetical protein
MGSQFGLQFAAMRAALSSPAARAMAIIERRLRPYAA